MATSAARKSARGPAEKTQLHIVEAEAERDAPIRDASLTVEAMANWTAGQRRCRARKRHNWNPFMVYEHRTWLDVVEQCSHCRNRRSAPFIRTENGARKVDKWKPDYRDGSYLLPKGAAPLDEDLYDELTGSDILSRKTVEVLDDDEEE